MLKLRIENFDKLPDGGPLEFEVDRRGFDFGRDQHLDWTLPDKSRVVSGKHCEVRFYDDAYWLFDVSTNGTFLNSNSKRMQSPYRLRDGDKLAIGDYILAVAVQEPEPEPMLSFQAATPAPAPPPMAPSSNAIWEVSKITPPPIDSQDLMPPKPEEQRAADFLHHAMFVPPVADVAANPRPKPVRVGEADVWGNDAGGASHAAVPAQPSDTPMPSVTSAAELQFAQMPRATVAAPPNETKEVSAPPPTGTAPSSGEKDFLRRFALGAGLPEDALATANAGNVAEEAGKLLNFVSSQLMAMLHARAEAKALSRSGHRTLIQQSDNNPLKFMPTAEEALRVMLGPRTKGYLDAHQTFESTFADLKMHQVASLAAMQAAATQLFDEFAPDVIEKSTEVKKSLLSNNKAKSWDTYVERWNSKVGRREHGMLGVFLELFAEQYDRLNKRSK